MSRHDASRPAVSQETVLAFPEVARPLRHARSTILIGSMAVLRGSQAWERYASALPSAARDVLLGAVAGVWLPVDTAVAHYRACDTLGLSVEQQVANGRATFGRAGTTIFGTITRMGREIGVTPWTLMPHMQRFWDRGYDGGSLRVLKLGPKEALVEAEGAPLLESPYFRCALRGVLWAAVDLFCTRAFVSERSANNSDSIALRAQWV